MECCRTGVRSNVSAKISDFLIEMRKKHNALVTLSSVSVKQYAFLRQQQGLELQEVARLCLC